MHGSCGISQSVVVDVETQELPDSVEIGSTVVMDGVDENVSVGSGSKEDEVVKEGVKEGVEEGVKEGVEEGVEEGVKEGVEEGVKDGVKEGVKEPVFTVVEKVWLAMLELPEPDTEVSVTVGAAN